MFNWNYKWGAKSYKKNYYLMRFPNKARLMELIFFVDFHLLGSDDVVNVRKWTLDSQAVGKLHIVWVKNGWFLNASDTCLGRVRWFL